MQDAAHLLDGGVPTSVNQSVRTVMKTDCKTADQADDVSIITHDLTTFKIDIEPLIDQLHTKKHVELSLSKSFEMKQSDLKLLIKSFRQSLSRADSLIDSIELFETINETSMLTSLFSCLRGPAWPSQCIDQSFSQLHLTSPADRLTKLSLSLGSFSYDPELWKRDLMPYWQPLNRCHNLVSFELHSDSKTISYNALSHIFCHLPISLTSLVIDHDSADDSACRRDTQHTITAANVLDRFMSEPRWLPGLESLELAHYRMPKSLFTTNMHETGHPRPIRCLNSELSHLLSVDTLTELTSLTIILAYESLSDVCDLPDDCWTNLSCVDIELKMTSTYQSAWHMKPVDTSLLTDWLTFLSCRELTHYTHKCELSLDDALVSALGGMTNLQHLVLQCPAARLRLSHRSNRMFLSPSIEGLVAQGSWPHLDTLSIDNFALANNQLDTLLLASPCLVHLKVRAMGVRIDPSWLSVCANQLPMLEVISVTGLVQLSAIDLDSIQRAFSSHPAAFSYMPFRSLTYFRSDIELTVQAEHFLLSKLGCAPRLLDVMLTGHAEVTLLHVCMLRVLSGLTMLRPAFIKLKAVKELYFTRRTVAAAGQPYEYLHRTVDDGNVAYVFRSDSSFDGRQRFFAALIDTLLPPQARVLLANWDDSCYEWSGIMMSRRRSRVRDTPDEADDQKNEKKSRYEPKSDEFRTDLEF